MPLQIPQYQLEEILDVQLKAPNNNIGVIKVRLLSILENESLDYYSRLSTTWLDLIGLEKDDISIMDEEIFYVGELIKPVQDFAKGELLVLPETWIDRDITKPSQKEPATIVFDFDFDYSDKVFGEIPVLISKIKEWVYEESKLEISGRQVVRYHEDDLKAIMTLLKTYYKVEDTQYNKDSVRNVLCSAANKQTVISKATNKQIEIYVDSSIRNKLVCTVYNKRNKEIKEFYF